MTRLLSIASAISVGLFATLNLAHAAPVKPVDPNFAWIFDGDNSALFGGIPGTRSGASGSNPSGPAFVQGPGNVPISYQSNRALDFDGTDDEFTVADSPSLRPGSGAWTTSFWFKAPDVDQDGGLLAKRENSSPFNQLQITAGTIQSGGTVTASKKLSILIRESGSSDWWFHTTDDVIDGQWHHAAFVRSGLGGGTLYVDGAIEALTQAKLSGTGPRDVNNTAPWVVGSNNGANFFEGLIDEVAFWNIELSGDNIEFLASTTINQEAFIPEPSSSSLLGVALFPMVRMLRRRRRRSGERA